jgi:hypothetical protein
VAAEFHQWRLADRPPNELPASVRVHAWNVQQLIWREEEDIRAIGAGALLRTLAGDHLASVYAFRDDAIVYEAHGYFDAAALACDQAMRLVRRLDLPEHQRLDNMAQITARRVTAAGPLSSAADSRQRRRAMAQALDWAGSAADLTNTGVHERVGLTRRLLELELQCHRFSTSGRRGRPPKLGVDEERVAATQQAIDASGGALQALTWRPTAMRIALATDDAYGFEVGVQLVGGQASSGAGSPRAAAVSRSMR